jgi:hypothetical protein
MSPTSVYYDATLRENLAWRIAQSVKNAERGMAGRLETKEVCNCANAVLVERLTLEVDAERGRVRHVTEWTHVGLVGEPVGETE